ncbi:MAG: rhomboid family intramembrane serine protease [Bacteroidia bacterium]
MNLLDNIRNYLKQYGFLGQLATIMVAFYMIELLIYLVIAGVSSSPEQIMARKEYIFRLFALPTGSRLLWWQPWSIVTYPFEYFSEKGLLRLLFDILIMFSFGQIFWSLLGQERLKRFMILAILSIGLISWLMYHISFLKADSVSSYYMSGMSAPIAALIAAGVVFMPNYEIFLFGIIRTKLLWVGVALCLIYVLNAGALPSRSESVSCLMAAGLGALYAYFLKNKQDVTEIVWDKAEEIIDRVKRRPTSAPFIKVKYRASDAEKTVSQEEIDRLLDKINEKGYNSLTEEEKDTLTKASKHNG